DRPVLAGVGDRLVTRLAHREDVHAVDLLARDAVWLAAAVELGTPGGGALDRRAHAVFVVLDHVDDRQLPQRRHVESFVDLPLVGRAVTEVAEADAAVLAIAVGEREPGAERRRRADDAVTGVAP